MGILKIKPDKLADVVKKELDDYADDVTDRVKKAVKETAKEAVKELKKTSPKRTGKYAKSWKQKKVKETSSELEIVVHAGKYQLTHLLEKGHAKRGGGRTRAFPHIKPAEEHAAEKLEKDIRKSVGRE